MEEVYWIDGAEFHYTPEEMTPDLHLSTAAAIFEKFLNNQLVPQGKIDEVHWLTDTVNGKKTHQVLTDAGLPVNLPFFLWKNEGMFDHYLLQSAARAVLVEDAHTMVLGQQMDCAASFLLLASPSAVGRYNLTPAAALTQRFSFSCATVASRRGCRDLQAQLERRKINPAEVNWLVLAGSCEKTSSIRKVFSKADMVSADADFAVGVLYQMNRLVKILRENRQEMGLIISQDDGGQTLATLVKRV